MIPALDLIQGVRPDNKIKGMFRVSLLQQRQGLGRVGVAGPLQLKVRVRKMRVAGNGQAHHVPAFFPLGYRVILLMGRMAGRHEPDLVQPVFQIGLFPQPQMPIVNGVKGSPQNSDFTQFTLPTPPAFRLTYF